MKTSDFRPTLKAQGDNTYINAPYRLKKPGADMMKKRKKTGKNNIKTSLNTPRLRICLC